MKRSRSLVAGLGLAVMLALAPAAAQTERVMIGARPASGQDVRFRLTQDSTFDVTPVGEASMGPMKMVSKMTTVMRQQVGQPESDGRLKLDFTYEQVTQEATQNGKKVDIPASASKALENKTVSVWLDPKYKVVDFKAPEGFPIPAAQLKMMLEQMMGAVPHQEMAIGETVAMPLSLPVPIPLPGDAPPLMKGETRTTLVKIAPDGADRIATLNQSLAASHDGAHDTPNGMKVLIKVSTDGSGTVETGVTSGLVRAMTMKSNIQGQFGPPPGTQGPPAMKISGIVNMQMERMP